MAFLLLIERYGKVYLIFLFSLHQASQMAWRVYSPFLPSSSLFSGRVREKPTRVRPHSQALVMKSPHCRSTQPDPLTSTVVGCPVSSVSVTDPEILRRGSE